MFKDIKKKAEEKASEVKDVTASVGSRVTDQAKNLGESASDLATGAVKTASDAASSAGKMAKNSTLHPLIVMSLKKRKKALSLLKIMVNDLKRIGAKRRCGPIESSSLTFIPPTTTA